MRIAISHRTSYRYDVPARFVIQKLRLTPRSHEGQYVRRWRIEVDHDCRLVEQSDAFSNIVHTFSLDGPVERLGITVDGDVETEDTHGVVKGAVERLPDALYLRQTPLTQPDTAISEWAADSAGGQTGLDALHALMTSLHERMTFDKDGTDTGTSATEAFTKAHGVCQDYAHIFIAAARSLGLPSRYVGGYLMHLNGEAHQEAGHAWAEALAPGIGWVGFDPANGICPTDAYVRVATGLDYLGVAPVRGARIGGETEAMDVAVNIAEVDAQQ